MPTWRFVRRLAARFRQAPENLRKRTCSQNNCHKARSLFRAFHICSAPSQHGIWKCGAEQRRAANGVPHHNLSLLFSLVCVPARTRSSTTPVASNASSYPRPVADAEEDRHLPNHTIAAYQERRFCVTVEPLFARSTHLIAAGGGRGTQRKGAFRHG